MNSPDRQPKCANAFSAQLRKSDLVFTVYNDIIGYQASVTAGKPAMINSAFGAVLTLIGAPIYLFYRTRPPRTAQSGDAPVS